MKGCPLPRGESRRTAGAFGGRPARHAGRTACRVTLGLQGCFMDQAEDGEMDQKESERLSAFPLACEACQTLMNQSKSIDLIIPWTLSEPYWG